MTFEERKVLVKSYLGNTVRIEIDRPIGYVHEKENYSLTYPINYGYIPGVLGGDGEELDVYLLGVDKPVTEYTGKIIGIAHRENDVEDKLVMALEGIDFSKNEIAQQVCFQEQYYKTDIEIFDPRSDFMRDQNIYDNEMFFDGYKHLRETDANYNDQLEQPAMAELIPDIWGKSVLDLGCGFGHNCIDFVKRGAKSVVGIDISEKMLDTARKESADEKIKYINMSMNYIGGLKEKFDLVYSSLAFHYVEDFNGLAENIYYLLNDDGYLIFSQEHPLVTATFGGHQHYNKDENGNYISFTFSNYGQPGKRDTFWYVDGVEKYHRRFSDIITGLCNAGFIIDTVCEPIPSEKADEKVPFILEKEQIKPTFLIVKARKAF